MRLFGAVFSSFIQVLFVSLRKGKTCGLWKFRNAGEHLEPEQRMRYWISSDGRVVDRGSILGKQDPGPADAGYEPHGALRSRQVSTVRNSRAVFV